MRLDDSFYDLFSSFSTWAEEKVTVTPRFETNRKTTGVCRHDPRQWPCRRTGGAANGPQKPHEARLSREPDKTFGDIGDIDDLVWEPRC